MFAVGDMHAAMGDGEICFTGVEIAGEVDIRFDVLKGKQATWPVTELADRWLPHATAPEYAEALALVSEEAARLLVDEHGFTMEDAFIFLSVACDAGRRAGVQAVRGLRDDRALLDPEDRRLPGAVRLAATPATHRDYDREGGHGGAEGPDREHGFFIATRSAGDIRAGPDLLAARRTIGAMAVRTMNPVHVAGTCAVAATAEIVGAKWTALLVHDLSEGPRRFSELERSCQGISPRTLAERLRALEAEGILERQSYPETPPRVEYSLTAKGESLLPIIDAMREFGHEWLPCGRPHPHAF